MINRLSAGNPLSGKASAVKKGTVTSKILLTRPQGSNGSLAEVLRQQGHDVRTMPLLAIQQKPETGQTRQTIMDIDHYQHVICSSKHATGILAGYLDQYWPQMPTGIHWYTLGKSSAQPLEKLGLIVSYPESGNTSEDLLSMSSLDQVSDQKILLIKGDGGRQELHHALASRGASVHLLELYQRISVMHTDDEVNKMLRWRPDIVVLMSGETIERFQALCNKPDSLVAGQARQTTRTCSQQETDNQHETDRQPMADSGQPWVGDTTTVIVPGSRLARIAESSGFRTMAAASATQEAILRAITAVIEVAALSK